MEILGSLAFLAIVAFIVIVLIVALPVAVVSMVFTPCKIAWVVGFIILKKTKTINISWWWILLGLLIPW